MRRKEKDREREDGEEAEQIYNYESTGGKGKTRERG